MNMSWVTAALVGFLIVLVFVSRRPKTAKSVKSVRPIERRRIPTKADTTYHAVSIRFVQSACDAAKALDGQRILSSDAPRIPLPDCDSQTCKCKFVHYKDRRTGDDRRDPYGQGLGGGNTGQFEEEQRKSTERRDEPPDDIF